MSRPVFIACALDTREPLVLEKPGGLHWKQNLPAEGILRRSDNHTATGFKTVTGAEAAITRTNTWFKQNEPTSPVFGGWLVIHVEVES